MKSTVLLLLLGISLNTWAGGNSKSDAIYNRYDGQDGVFSMTFSQTLIDAVDMEVDWKEQMKYVTGDLTKLRFMVFSDDRLDDGSIKQVVRSFKRAGYEEIELEEDEESDASEEIRVMVIRDGDRISEIHFISTGADDSQGVFSIYGDLLVRDQN